MDKDLSNMLVVCGVVIGAAILIITASYLIIGHDDGRPEWANDMASQLDEKGGRIDYYGDAVRDYSGATPVFRVTVTIDQDVRANAQGIIIEDGYGMIQIPYERVYAIYPTGGMA